jgi:hypothetical protein
MGTVRTEAIPTMKRLNVPALICALAASTWAPTPALAQDVAPEKVRTLDLSLPQEAPSRAWGAPAATDATRLPDLGGQPSRPSGVAGPGRGSGHRGDLPYGAGYEARRGEGGGGRGMGRGRGR